MYGRSFLHRDFPTRIIKCSFIVSKSAGMTGWNQDLNRICKMILEPCHFEDLVEQAGVPISRNVAYLLLKRLHNRLDTDCGRRLQFLMVQGGLDSIAVLGDQIIRLFTSSGCLPEANQAFTKISCPSIYTWSAIVSGNVRFGKEEIAVALYNRMQLSHVESDGYMYVAILNACAGMTDLKQGKLIHCQLIKSVSGEDRVVGNAIINMYAKCGSLWETYLVFARMQNQDAVSWSAMIAAYIQHGYCQLALELYKRLQLDGMQPDRVMFLTILNACGSTETIGHGRVIHSHIISKGLQLDIFLGNTLIGMYARCGSLKEARTMFDLLQKRDVVSWAAMIAGYVQHGQGQIALVLYENMQFEGLKPDKVTFLSILKACAIIGAIEYGMLVHSQITNSGLELDPLVGSSLVDMYSKCGNLEEAQNIFNRLQNQDIVCWSALIVGYSRHGDGLHALELFKEMQHKDLRPETVTFSSILKACGDMGALGRGRFFHDEIIRNGLESDIVVTSALVDMYAKCGKPDMARRLLDESPNKNVVSWAAMLAGYARSGNVSLVEECFNGMQKMRIKPNDAVFTSILSACSHAGLVDKGCCYFRSMIEEHELTPSINQINCMVDLLARAGYLNDAGHFLQACEPDVIGWLTLLTACRTYTNVDLGSRCFNQVIELDRCDASSYVIMENLYADARMWVDAKRIEDLRKRVGAWKKPAKAWIEVNNEVHEFIVGDKTHPQSNEIYALLKKLSSRMKDEGYIPEISLVSAANSESEKEDALCGHCEKLAIAYGILTTPPDVTIRATKNLRVCIDCHNATKIISKIEKREIVIRDAYRIHHFKHGECSCGEYC